MIVRPRLKDHLGVVVIGPRLAVLVSDVEHWNLDGPVYPRLVPLLDGSRSMRMLLEELRGTVSIAEALAALSILEESGYLVDGCRRRPPAPCDGAIDAAVRMLDRLGLKASGTRESGDLTFVPTDEYLRRDMADFAELARRDDLAWLPMKSTGTVIWLGPVVHPPATPCWECVLARVRANRPAHAWLQSRGAYAARRPGPHAPLVLGHGRLDATSNPLLKQLTRSGSMVALDPRTGRATSHVVVRRPECPLCGSTAAAAGSATMDRRIVLSRRLRIRSSDGGWRATAPDHTFKRYRHHISRWTGIVSRISRRTMDAGQMELYSAEHLFVPSDSDPLPTSRRLSSGKGIGRAQARTSALCEALERYSGMFRGSETRLRASYETLREVAVPPNACTTFSDAQFDNRDVWNSRSVPHCHVPRRLDERQNIDWSPVWSLTHDRVRYVPTAYCYYGYRAAPDEQCCRADSNGCAAGSGLEEAILQGFLELVERDAVAIWWYNGIKRPALDLRTFSRPFFRTMIAEYARGGRSLTVFDLTTDLGIPVFAAASEAENSGATELLLGFGAHLDAETAVARAITELNQWRCGTALGVAGTSFSQSGRGLGAFLRRGRSVRPRRLEDFACADHADLRDAVLDCVERARHCGLEVLVLDQTREDVGLSVVRVIVPGLRHFWPRFGPGRLYDVPVALGWRRTPKTERQLNNFHITI